MSEKSKKLYIGIFLGVIAMPFIGMPFYKTDMSVEKRYAQVLPKIWKEGKLNRDYFDEWDRYVSDHFAFRQEMATADAILLSKTFQESNTEKVIVGKDGWLYFQETLDDYLGRNLLSEREIHNCAKVLALLQEGAEAEDCEFVVTIAPNKNSLYPECMPERYVKESDENNFSRLVPELERQGVRFVNLHEAFLEQEKVMYHKLDSHWNNEGAVLACDRLLSELGKEHTDYSQITSHIEKNFAGDLKGMIYPKWNLLDDNVSYDKEHIYSYIGDVRSTEDMSIETENPDADGSVVMFRDSFGNALLPYVADEYAHGFFTKGVPFRTDLIDQYDADTMILEVVERHIPTLIGKVPVMAAPERETKETTTRIEDSTTTIETQDAGEYIAVYGSVDPEYLGDDSDIYIELTTEEDTHYYEAFPAAFLLPDADTNLSIQYGLYLDKDVCQTDDVTIHVITQKDGEWYCTGLFNINQSKKRPTE